MEGAVFKSGANVLLLYLIANVETSAAGTNKPLSPQIFLTLGVVLAVLPNDCADAEVPVFQFCREILL